VLFANWFLGCFLIYAFLFGIGYVIFAPILEGMGLLLLGAIANALILRNLQRTAWERGPDKATTTVINVRRIDLSSRRESVVS